MFGFTDQYIREPILVAEPERKSLGIRMPVVKDTTVVPYGDDIDVATFNTTAADVRNVAELQRRIRAAGGVLVVGPNSSDYLVAVNNRLRFSVRQVGPDRFEIRESNSATLLIAVAVIGAVVLFNRSR